MIEQAKIKDLPFNPAKKLNNSMRSNIVKVIENEFENQTSLQQEDITVKKERALEIYRKKSGYTRLLAKVNKKQVELNLALVELHKSGLGTDGNIRTSTYGNKPEDENAEKLEATIQKIACQHKEPRTIKNKIISRIWISDTVGEAIVILNEVMGNGLLPTVSKAQLGSLMIEDKASK